MKRILALLLALSLPASQARLFAEEPQAPDLPAAADAKEEPKVEEGAKADVAVPEGEPVAKKAEPVDVAHKEASRFRWGNFLLGALGGALIVGGAGILGFAQDSKGAIDYPQAGVYAVCGALGGGLLSWALGATSVPPATPPELKGSSGDESRLPGQNSPKQLVFSMHF